MYELYDVNLTNMLRLCLKQHKNPFYRLYKKIVFSTVCVYDHIIYVFFSVN